MKNNMPDVFYYQTNGRSATENYIEQKKAIYERLTEVESDNGFNVNFTSKVKIV